MSSKAKNVFRQETGGGISTKSTHSNLFGEKWQLPFWFFFVDGSIPSVLLDIQTKTDTECVDGRRGELRSADSGRQR